MSAATAFNLTRQEQVAIITIDVPDQSVNTLRSEFVEQFQHLLHEIREDRDIKGVLIESGKPDNFIAGADIHMLSQCTSVADAKALATAGQQLFSAIEQFPIPVIAMIDGSCLGGGLELALACHYRICSDAKSVKLGLPEVQLGLLPGSGGTQRLPRLIGISSALDLMLTGKQVNGKKAQKLGLVDDCVPRSILKQTALKQLTLSPQSRTQGRRNQHQPWWLRTAERLALGRSILFKQARKRVAARTHGLYPAPPAIIDVVESGYQRGREQGFSQEAQRFAELVMSPESFQLRQIFLTTTAMKHNAAQDAAHDVNQILVLGGGLMGGGIAYVSAAKAGCQVFIKDIEHKAISHALNVAYQQLTQRVKRRRLHSAEREQVMMRLTGDVEYTAVEHTDLVIEAVVEDLAIKQQMVKDIETLTSEQTIFASNTSSLRITDIASAAERPQHVVGLHYFSPVEKMPLAEVIAHQQAAPEAIATAVDIARRQGKTPIVVQDGPGFYVNRILTPYMIEAAWLLHQGEPISVIDDALVQFGFPLGPFKLLDEVGIDIGAKITPILAEGLGERFSGPPLFKPLLDDDRRGKKNGKGFYKYSGRTRSGSHVDKTVYSILNVSLEASVSHQDIVQRCVFAMLNEAARCLEEGIISSAADGDIGAIFGIGFPPFRGGPFRYMDSIGVAHVVDVLHDYEQQIGERFAPCSRLIAMAEHNQTFY